MSSRFVSAGTVNADGTTVKAVESAGAPVAAAASSAAPAKPDLLAKKAKAKTEPVAAAEAPRSERTAAEKARQAEWAAVERRLEDERRKLEAFRQAKAAGAVPDKSLYEMLEANKAAKQAAYDEAARLSNQFRALDDDEVAFLDEVEARARAEARARQAETAAGLAAFRAAQEAAAHEQAYTGQGLSFAIKKRKRAERAGFPNLKRRAETQTEKETKKETEKETEKTKKETQTQTKKETEKETKKETDESGGTLAKPRATPSAQPKPTLLVAYDSDSE